MFEARSGFVGWTFDELSVAVREASVAVARAEAHRLAVVAEWDRRQAWAADGAYNGGCWLAEQCTLSRAEACGILRTARVVGVGPGGGGGGGRRDVAGGQGGAPSPPDEGHRADGF